MYTVKPKQDKPVIKRAKRAMKSVVIGTPRAIEPPAQPEIPVDLFSETAGPNLWHKKLVAEFPYTPESQYTHQLTFISTIMGCGIAQMSGSALMSSNPKGAKKALQKALLKLKTDGVGAIICTLGEVYWNKHEPLVLDCGFTLLKEYSNYRHGKDGKYHQRLYILTL